MSVMLSVLTGLYVWGNSIDSVLQEWQIIGVFEYVLPFLLVFAVIFGILTTIHVFGENKGINLVIALAMALLAITSSDFRGFFTVITAYAAIGLAILLVFLILTGLFHSGDSWWKNVFTGMAIFIAVVVILSALSSYEVAFLGSWWWREYMSTIIVGAIIIGLILLVVFWGKGQGGQQGGQQRGP